MWNRVLPCRPFHRILPFCTLLLALGVPAPARLAPWSDAPTGFASVRGLGQNGTTGGARGRRVTVTTQQELARWAARKAPCVIRVAGRIKMQPKGTEIRVVSDKTIIGAGKNGQIIGGGFFLPPGTHNVIIRNLTIRDTYVEGDPEGKTQDFDGLQIDSAHHIWIDHCHLARHGDGIMDLRKGTTFVTVSWCILSDHNKVGGSGWTDKVETQLTMHHNWFRNTRQRNPAIDNALRAHLYNNYLQNVSAYGHWARGRTNMIVENSLFEKTSNPLTVEKGTLVERGCVFRHCTKGGWPWGADTRGPAFFNPKDFYRYRLDPAEDLPELLARHAGPQESIGR